MATPLKLVPAAPDQAAAYDEAGGGQGGGVFDASGRRIIQHDPGKLPEVLDAIGAALFARPTATDLLRLARDVVSRKRAPSPPEAPAEI